MIPLRRQLKAPLGFGSQTALQLLDLRPTIGQVSGQGSGGVGGISLKYLLVPSQPVDLKVAWVGGDHFQLT